MVGNIFNIQILAILIMMISVMIWGNLAMGDPEVIQNEYIF
jgi:hypothetical protein